MLVDSVAQKLGHTPRLNGVQCSTSQPCRMCQQFQNINLTRTRFGNPSVEVAIREQARRRAQEQKREQARRRRR